VVLSLAPEYVINLATLVPDQATNRLSLTDWMPPFKPDFMVQVLLFSFMLPLVFNLLISLS
jgi:hypothetical protein